MALDDVFLEKLKELARQDTVSDERERDPYVVIDDFAGGNVDDAYWTGHNDGQTDLAREILEKLKLW